VKVELGTVYLDALELATLALEAQPPRAGPCASQPQDGGFIK
jgi:hypothetical protein